MTKVPCRRKFHFVKLSSSEVIEFRWIVLKETSLQTGLDIGCRSAIADYPRGESRVPCD